MRVPVFLIAQCADTSFRLSVGGWIMAFGAECVFPGLISQYISVGSLLLGVIALGTVSLLLNNIKKESVYGERNE